MSDDKELQVRLQFLEEAGEYLDTIETGLLGLGSGKVNSQQMDGILRAAHSIKGGAAMMGFQSLSHLAHRLEDFFKVLKVGKSKVVDSNLETLLLSTIDFFRQIVVVNRQRKEVEPQWLETTVNPVFEQLHDRLGNPQPEDAAVLLSAEMGEDMSTLIFETEVEELLSNLETTLANLESTSNLLEELNLAAHELSGLGEILELPAFFSLSQSVITKVAANPNKVTTIAEAAIQEWRRSQALVLVGQIDVLPQTLELDEDPTFFGDAADSVSGIEELPDSNDLASLLETEDLEQEALEIFSSIESILPQEFFATESQFPEIPLEDSVVETTSEPNSVEEFPQSRVNVSVPFQSITSSSSEIDLDGESHFSSDRTIRVSTEQLEQLSDLFGEVAIKRNGIGLRLKSMRNLVNLLTQRIKTLAESNFRLRIAYDKVATETATTFATKPVASPEKNLVELDQISEKLKSSSTPEDGSSEDSANYFDSLEMDRYSDVHLLSQEVMETIVQIQEVTKDIEINLEDTEKNSRELNRTTKQMQNTITKVRMRPLYDLLNRFPRALRDLELQYGKKVQLKVRGGSTLIERSVLEVLNDPLLHLFRNAIDH